MSTGPNQLLTSWFWVGVDRAVKEKYFAVSIGMISPRTHVTEFSRGSRTLQSDFTDAWPFPVLWEQGNWDWDLLIGVTWRAADGAEGRYARLCFNLEWSMVDPEFTNGNAR